MHPGQLHRDSESHNKERGNQQVWELRPAMAKHRGKDAGASNLLMVRELEGPAPRHESHSSSSASLHISSAITRA